MKQIRLNFDYKIKEYCKIIKDYVRPKRIYINQHEFRIEGQEVFLKKSDEIIYLHLAIYTPISHGIGNNVFLIKKHDSSDWHFLNGWFDFDDICSYKKILDHSKIKFFL